jgi:aryl-alcohol dehydrogenase-like predicted oxidoreductase
MIEHAPFGRTGHSSTRVIFGAASLSRVDQETADRVLATVEAYGVNHIDTAAMYGRSERRLAPWLANHRQSVFLATKTGMRRGVDARGQLEHSLERMGIDHVDLVQLHNLVEDDEWEEAHGPGGALEALLAARDEGLTRFVGVTGHGLRIPRMHIRSLQRHDYDSVLFPYNWALMANEDYRRDVTELLELCRARQVAAQTIKSIARRRWDGERLETARSWYEPLDEPEAISRAVNFVLSEPDIFLCSSSDYEQLPKVLEAAAGPIHAPTAEEMALDVERQGLRPLFDGAALERI